MTFRPGQIKKEFVIDLPRPAGRVEDADVAATARVLLGYLRAEIEKAFLAEAQP